MVRDALDETGKNFLRLILRRVFHGRCGRIPSCTHAFCSSRRLAGNIGRVTYTRTARTD
jgi:hypothetical protein